MFVYGKQGRKAPYAIKVLTQMQLSKLLVQKPYSSASIIISTLLFSDSTNQ
jgi:hypothetical protein